MTKRAPVQIDFNSVAIGKFGTLVFHGQLRLMLSLMKTFLMDVVEVAFKNYNRYVWIF